jgi:hypothetical protein
MVFNNDARAAFDRMIPSVGGIALRRLGACVNAVEALLRTLEKMRYKIRAALGISDGEFSNVTKWVLGTLQGSGASPCLWLAVMCLLLGALAKRSGGLLFVNSRDTLKVKRICEAYVDDTKLWRSLSEAELTAMAKDIEDIAQYWEQLLYTTGGPIGIGRMFFRGYRLEV